MSEFFHWLSANSTGAVVLISLIACALLTFIATLIIGFIQGREIGFWPPRIGPRSSQQHRPGKTKTKYDVFLSSPMAAFVNDDLFQKDRKAMLEIVDAMRDECGFSVFYAGRNVKSLDDFDAPDLSIAADVRALKESSIFVLFYSEKIVSSVLVEAGFALALAMPSIYFVRRREDLPFLLRSAEQGNVGVKIYEVESTFLGHLKSTVMRNCPDEKS